MHGHESHEHDHGSHRQDHVAELPRETEGLPEARETELIELADGDEFELEIVPVKKQIGDATVRMLAYNGSVPGPTLKVPQGATITVHVTNNGDIEATVHWHGLRLENRYDGTHETRRQSRSARPSRTRCTCPTPAPSGTTRTSARTTARRWASTGTSSPPRARPTTGRRPTASCLLTLDDILIEDGQIAAFQRVGDDARRDGSLRQRDARRAASLTCRSRRSAARSCASTSPTPRTRASSMSTLPGAQMKLVGADAGHYEREELVERSCLRRPSGRRRRALSGRRRARARAPDARAHVPACRRSTSSDEPPEQSFADEFASLRTNARHGRATRARRAVPEGAARQDALVRRRDGHGRARGRRQSSTSARCTPRW